MTLSDGPFDLLMGADLAQSSGQWRMMKAAIKVLNAVIVRNAGRPPTAILPTYIDPTDDTGIPSLSC